MKFKAVGRHLKGPVMFLDVVARDLVEAKLLVGEAVRTHPGLTLLISLDPHSPPETKYVRRAEVVDAARWFKSGDHGWVDKKDTKVCPGDWIVTNEDGSKTVVEPTLFKTLYEIQNELS